VVGSKIIIKIIVFSIFHLLNPAAIAAAATAAARLLPQSVELSESYIMNMAAVSASK